MKLNQLEGTNKYRLPTEAEWEYACRAGSTTRYYFGDDKSSLDQHAWYMDNSGHRIHSVSEKKPNAWGLYDMYGNASEWCQDWYGDYHSGHVTDPRGPSRGKYRVLRGGSSNHLAFNLRSSLRGADYPHGGSGHTGFRVARDF
jgi:formylglycine-generating enzyme required for sulfatase activity